MYPGVTDTNVTTLRSIGGVGEKLRFGCCFLSAKWFRLPTRQNDYKVPLESILIIYQAGNNFDLDDIEVLGGG
jgi:hypothetical protein